MIGLPVSIGITLIICLFFFFQHKALSFLQNSIVYMVLAMVATNYNTIMEMNLDKIETTENPFLFIAFLLYRDILIPLIVLQFVNAYFKVVDTYKKIFYILFYLLLINGLEYLFIYFKVIRYTHWTYIGGFIVICSYLLIGLGLARLVLYAQKRSKDNDSGL